MRKLLAFLVLLILPWAARGQALADWYYWFDADAAPRESGKIVSQQFQLQPDVSHLPTGVHTLYVQVVDTAGVYSAPVGTMFYKVAGSNQLTEFRYWFDSDASVRTMPYGQGHYVLDVAHLTPGFHFINYYVADAEENMTKIDNAGFFRLPMASNLKLHYWFAGDAVATQVPDFQDGFVVDVARLEEGFNTIYFQLEDNGPTDIQAEHFIKIPQTENGGDMTLVCIIDGKIVGEEKVAAHGGVVKCDMDVSNMEVGLHKAMFQLITPSGAGSSIAETYFLRTLTTDEVATMQCSYTIDGFKHYTQKGTMANGTFHFDLPVDEVEDGLHRLDYLLVAENGVSTTQGSAWFVKTPLGGNAVTQYDYWLNDKSDEVYSVALDEPKDPFQLVKLLPVTTEPIRSSCFHFEVKDDTPMVYAKNDIHFRFHDKSGRYIDDSKQYVDYNVNRNVDVVKTLTEVYGRETFEVPDSGAVRWYTMECAKGDSIAVQASQATSIQIFAPSGKEVYNVSGPESVKLGGMHAREDGTYYFAIHDVTGSKPEMTLNYQHIDKYAILDYDVHTVGNGGCSTITFNGNGFNDLYAVDLVSVNGSTINHIDIGHEHDANTTVTFDFTGSALGQYDAIFHFTQEDRTVKSALKVETAKDIELSTKVTYPSTFLRGTSVTYTVEITNKGNMTAYAVPLYAWIQSNTKEGVKSIDIDGLNLKRLVDYADKDSCTSEVYTALEELSCSLSDDHYFMKFKTVNVDNLSDSVVVRSSYFTTQLAPNEKKTINFTILSDEIIQVYITVPSDWYSVYTEAKTYRQMAKFSSERAKSSYCCYREQVECVANIVVDAFDFASLFGGPALGAFDCVVGGLSQVLSAAGDIACGKNDVGSELAKKANSVAKGMSIAGSLLSCASGYNKLKQVKDILGALVQTGDMILYPKVAVDCINGFKEKKPNCPPDPPKGGSSSPRNSCEPNDIRGYTSESGSTFMRDDVDEVTYIIDSENDPVFADAPAHTVIITDTINGRYYDLESLSTRNITIGDVSMDLDGTEQNFIKTIDLRPRLNVVAQVEQKYDPTTGIAKWIWTSLDPMTMEPTDDVMQGVLPVNDETRNGEGHITYRLKQKTGLPDGTKVTNQADIIFDANDPVFTPVWTNIIDAVPPTSHVCGTEMLANDSVRVHFEGADERSGVWKYTLYVQYGENAGWEKVAETDSTFVDFKPYKNIDHGFCVLATDSAGNVEPKTLVREWGLQTFLKGDANSDGKVDMKDAILVLNHYVGIEGTFINASAADANGDGVVDVKDAIWVADHYVHDTKAVKTIKKMIKRYKIRVL